MGQVKSSYIPADSELHMVSRTKNNEHKGLCSGSWWLNLTVNFFFFQISLHSVMLPLFLSTVKLNSPSSKGSELVTSSR